MASAQKVTTFGDLPIAAKVLLLAMLLGVVTALYYFVFHLPLAEELDAADSAFADLQTQEADARQRQQEYLQLSEQLAGQQAADRENRRVLPENPEIPAFLQTLNRLGELSGLEFKLVEPRPEEAGETFAEEQVAAASAPQDAAPAAPAPLYNRIPVSLELRGRFHQVAKFFYNVSGEARAISMENVRLQNPTIEGEEVYLDVSVLATTFRRLPSASAPAAGEGAAQ